MRRVPVVLALALVTGGLQAQVAWGPRPPGGAPAARYGHAMAWDPARGEIVLFGGFDASAPLNDTWVWKGRWRQRFPMNVPPARGLTAMVFDAARGKTVLFGGAAGIGSAFNDTWEWDGRDWAQRTPATTPQMRAQPAMAYDAGRRRVVLFGGSFGSGSLGDTWEWDGTDWQDVTPSQGPSARRGASLCFDGARNVCLMFGGYGLSGTWLGHLDETWTWNGRSWSQLAPSVRPPGCEGAALAHDPARQRVVLFGGKSGAPLLWHDETWEWDGTTWIPRVFGAPPARSEHAMAFDHRTARLVLFGGWDGSAPPFADTWEYFNLTPAEFESFGTGCAGSAGIPVLGPVGPSVPWIGETLHLDLRPIASGAQAAPHALLGASNETWGSVPLPLDLGVIGMPSCLLQVSIDIAIPLTNQGGWAELLLPIPYEYRLVGAPFFVQAMVLDAGGGSVVSNAGQCSIGAK